MIAWRSGRAANICVAALALGAAASVQAQPQAAGRAAAFVSAHGRRALVMGYPETGLEVWAYPLQVLSDYQVRFHEDGRVAPLDGRLLLRRVEVRPWATTRVYVGPDFVVRERLFTPLNRAAARIDYEVEGRPHVTVEVRFRPSLNLMWPGALGGQSVNWDAGRSAYIEREPLHGFSAVIGSTEAIAHDDPINAARDRSEDLALSLDPRPAPGGLHRASVVIDADLAGHAGPTAVAEAADRQLAEAQAHYAGLSDEGLRISTPDPAFDAALRDAQTMLDQAWVCAPEIGCGEVAGYGPSRPERRPQYAWFFAGDGLVATEGLIATGRYDRARAELAFITRFQNPSNGMIWHEMSLSAPYIDWSRYPYMYVHVDITLQYLATLASYVQASGDTAFLKANWPHVEAAWRYASALVDPSTDLPTIPPGKQGQNEQLQLRDDARLSSAWIDAADGFARLARAEGALRAAKDAERASEQARRALAASAWDGARGFWVGGHTVAGTPVRDERSDAMRLLQQGVFTSAEVDTVLDRLSSPDFLTDWGERSQSAASADYDPNAYSQGAVWGLGSSVAASAFWDAHRPLAAWRLLHGLSAWNTLDSPGHLHEVVAGDLYHPEVESVPEQTWSSAGLLASAVHGLLGLDIDAARRTLTFQPHLPGDWTWTDVYGVEVGASRLALRLHEDQDGVLLTVDNQGQPVAVDFAPAIPLGARLLSADVDGRQVSARIDRQPQEEEARLAFTAASGSTRVVIRYAGGVRIAPVAPAPEPGDPSRNMNIASISLADGELDLQAYVADPDRTSVDLFTPWKVKSVTGGVISIQPDGTPRLTLAAPASSGTGAPAHATVFLAPG